MAVHSLLSYVVRSHSDMEIYGQTAGKNQKKYMASLALYITAWLILISGPLLRRGMEVTMLDIGQETVSVCRDQSIRIIWSMVAAVM